MMTTRNKAISVWRAAVAVTTVVWSVSATDWATFRGNPQRTGSYPKPAGYPVDSAAWVVRLGGPIVSSPVVSDGRIFVGTRDSCLYALDAGSGRILWKMRSGGWIDATPTVHKGITMVGSRDGNVHLVDAQRGEKLAAFAAGLQLSSVAVSDENLVLCGLGYPHRGMAAYKLGSALRWEASGKPHWVAPLSQLSYSSPALRGQYAVIGAGDGKLYGIDNSSGDTLWSVKTDGNVYLSTPAIDDTTVYFAPGEYDVNVYAVSLRNGKVLWRNAVASAGALAKKRMGMSLATPLQQQELLRYSPGERLRLIRQMNQQGTDLVRVRVAGTAGLARASAAGAEFIPSGCLKTSSVAVDRNYVYVVQKHLGYLLMRDGNVDNRQQFVLQALDKRDGRPVWHFSEYRSAPKLGYCSSPVAAGDLVFAAWGEGKVYGLRKATGEKVWEHTVDGHVISSPAIDNGILYVATMNGALYAFKLSETPPGETFRTSTFFYPNPARGAFGHIQVFVTRAADLTLTIYNTADKPVLRHSVSIGPGKYMYRWGLGAVANGVYFARISVKYSDGTIERKNLKMAVLR